MKVTVAGIGPGNDQYILPLVAQAAQAADVVIGYAYYFRFIDSYISESAEKVAMPLGQEKDRALLALSRAKEGKHVLVIGSGDAGIYSMAALVYELAAKQKAKEVELETLPGISAFLAAGSKLGAPLGHDFCCISLSDLMTPWGVIEKRIKAAALGDFVTSIYNPKSKKRYWQLGRLKTLFLEQRSENTPVAIIRQVTRPDESIKLTTLGALNPDGVDMFSLVMIGNSQTFRYREHLVTPRGYLNRKPQTGEEIQKESFRIIAGYLEKLPLDQADKWALLRIIHSTGIPEDYQNYKATAGAIAKWQRYLHRGGDVVTDVTMVKSGISKKYTAQYGVRVHCFLNDEDVIEEAEKRNITRSQAGIRKAMKQYPKALYAIGNAPTALMDLTDELLANEDFKPIGIIGVPVGFVNVIEAKAQLAQSSADYVMMEGNRGGSNVAAAIVNAAFSCQLSVVRESVISTINH